MRGAAAEAMSDIVEERQQSRYAPFAAAPPRAAARRPSGLVARSSHTAPGIARRSRLASGRGGYVASFWRETKDPEGVQQDSPGRKPWVQGPNCRSPERAAQGVRSQLQINARHKAPLWYRDQLHRPFGASLVTVLVPRACAL